MKSSRVAIVTGGNRGIGRGIALGLAKDGVNIAVNYRRDKDAASRTLDDLEVIGVKANAYEAPVDSFEAVRDMVDQVHRDFGQIDILINNAGIASKGHSIADTDPREFERVVRIHCFGTFYVTHAALPYLRKSDRGDVVMISSAATRNYMGYGSPYNVGKAGIEALALGLAKEELVNNIRVNIVAPGIVETDMGRRLVKATRKIENIRDIDASSPFGRVCQPEDVANVVRFLVSENNSYLTGEKIYVDGNAGLIK
tara:strand:+ start:226 stop:990 length:765 start_codon:yes stop_codon:yes gene_type:complete